MASETRCLQPYEWIGPAALQPIVGCLPAAWMGRLDHVPSMHHVTWRGGRIVPRRVPSITTATLVFPLHPDASHSFVCTRRSSHLVLPLKNNQAS